MDTLLYQQIEELVSPVIVILIFTLLGVYGLICFFFVKSYCSYKNESKKEEREDKEYSNNVDELIDNARKEFISFREQMNATALGYRQAYQDYHNNQQAMKDDINTVEGAILELDDRLVSLEKNVDSILDTLVNMVNRSDDLYIYQKKEKVGKKNASKK